MFILEQGTYRHVASLFGVNDYNSSQIIKYKCVSKIQIISHKISFNWV